ncbi:nucleotide-diphospho-sugar transferases [Lucifera butyrica]|uniref:Nucleotide-diphospho-sugar transferases n=1 Tax=Lucifera butyrica TaxID=1351585 RepID=A0A498R2Q0_9FIRM|nr:glucose-1-phosphate adenylyltransferase subunit GlgD [Lucifera butyrica]VBB05040.1 nucleotide-diphospho-sugar transferases [Lucifera butyrica]
MDDVLGLINLYEPPTNLAAITQHRPLAAVPFGGRYRLIDFVLSSMVNSGIRNVGIMVEQKCRSLLDHLRSGKEWDLARKRDGLFILPPPEAVPTACGDLHNFQYHLDYIRKSRQKYVLITAGDTICNVNYREPFAFHRSKQAEVTLLYTSAPGNHPDAPGIKINIGQNGRLLAGDETSVAGGLQGSSLEMYILQKDLFADLIQEGRTKGYSDFGCDVILKNRERLKIFAYPHNGYTARIRSLSSYYRQNMGLLQPEIWQELFYRSGLIYTKIKDEAPVKYRETASVKNALIANGCIIEGQVENSILFRGVRVRKGACVKNSIIMQKGDIAENAAVEFAICDKDVSVTAGKKVRGTEKAPLVIAKGCTI